MSEVNKESNPSGRRGGQSFRMSQLLRAAFPDVSDLPPPRDAVLSHFSDRHPLLRLHVREGEGIKCNFCDIIISGWAYACEKHCDYYLHDVCSNFPRDIRHDFHPGSDHTFMLKPFHPTCREQFHCVACGHNDFVHYLFQSYYGCKLCNFNLHVECASIPIALYHNVKFPLHLFVTFAIISETATLFCSICAKVNPNSGCWLFYNHEHDYLCHFDCAAVSEYCMENNSMGKLHNRMQTLATTNRPPTLAGQLFADITHFSHRHPLKEYNSAKPLACNLCNFEFSTGYFCSGCNYFIDKMCFSIPSMIQRMSHLQLEFVNKKPKCPGCSSNLQASRARAYYCTPCKFYINRQCAGAPKTLTLADNISYELLFEFPFKHEKEEIKCNICSKKVVTNCGLFYYNLERDEALHICCALRKESENNVAKMDRLSIQRLNEASIAE